jgi:hypothetical protein
LSNGTWRDIVEIIGPRDIIVGLFGMDGLRIEDHGQRQLDDGQVRVTAYATQDAANQARAAGCTVNLIISGPDLEQLAHDDASTREDEDGGVV